MNDDFQTDRAERVKAWATITVLVILMLGIWVSAGWLAADGAFKELMERLFAALVGVLVGTVLVFGAWATWYHITGRRDNEQE